MKCYQVSVLVEGRIRFLRVGFGFNFGGLDPILLERHGSNIYEGRIHFFLEGWIRILSPAILSPPLLATWFLYLMVPYFMLRTYDVNKAFFRKKNRILLLSRCNQMTSTNRNA